MLYLFFAHYFAKTRSIETNPEPQKEKISPAAIGMLNLRFLSLKCVIQFINIILSVYLRR